ncbi:Calmodulin protein 11 [Pelomyxa schiedti]|nr:Calmodulin protein 11 [Pelomyxa schiedti]
MAAVDEKDRDLKQVFDMFDRNHDGKISTSEIADVLRALNQDPNDYDIEGMISEVDTDNNGTVEFEEFKAMMAKAEQTEEQKENDLRKAFNVFDLDQDGFITKEELKAGMVRLGETDIKDDQIRAMIKDADINGDGKIDFAEFCRMMKQ